MIPAWTLAMMESATAGFTPLDLGAKLIAWWAPPVSGDNVTLSGSDIASWTDEVGGYALSQATAANRPAYAATGFGGLACAEFDGVNDHLSLSPVPAAFPATGGGELWVSCRQDALVADSSIRRAFSYGTGSRQRLLWREVSGGANRAVFYVNTTTPANPTDLSGIHIMRGVATGTHVRADVDEVVGSELAQIPDTDLTGVVAIGSNPGGSGAFWHGAVRQALVTALLTNDEAAALYGWLNEGL